MLDENSTQSVPYGSGAAFITLIRKADGAAVEPPQALAVEGIQDISWDDKNTIKESHGEGAYAARLAGGKKSLSLSLTISELTGKHLNALCYGQDTENRQLKIHQDKVGYAIPSFSQATVKIGNSIQLNLARIDSHTSMTINGAAATASTLDVLPAGKFRNPALGQYEFAADDVNKTAVITFDSNGTALELTLKIPKRLTFNLGQFTGVTKIIKGTVTALTKKLFNPAGTLPVVDSYQASPNGIVVFNSAQTGVMTITHNTDGIIGVTTKIAALPAAAYGAYIDAAAASVWTSTLFVQLKTDSGAAMTGTVVGEELTKVLVAPTVSGTYLVDSKGYHLFYSADAGDVVTIAYTTDYQFFTVTPPDDGVFTRDLGVRYRGGVALTRVALTSPLSLLHDQYAVSDNGTYYIDQANDGDTLYFNYQYEVAGVGSTIVVENNKIGQAPTLMLDLLYDLDGEMTTVSFERAKPMGTGIPTKQEDFAGMKFEFKAFANRETGVVYTVSTSV